MLKQVTHGGGYLNYDEVNRSLNRLRLLSRVQYIANIKSWFKKSRSGYIEFVYTGSPIIFLAAYDVPSAGYDCITYPYVHSIIDQNGGAVSYTWTSEYNTATASENKPYSINRLNGHDLDYYGYDSENPKWNGFAQLREYKLVLSGVSTGTVIKIEFDPIHRVSGISNLDITPFLNLLIFSHKGSGFDFTEAGDELTAVNHNHFERVITYQHDVISHAINLTATRSSFADQQVMSSKINGMGKSFRGLDNLADWTIGYKNEVVFATSGDIHIPQIKAHENETEDNTLYQNERSHLLAGTVTNYPSLDTRKLVVNTGEMKGWYKFLSLKYDFLSSQDVSNVDTYRSDFNEDIKFLYADFSNLVNEVFNSTRYNFPLSRVAGDAPNIRLLRGVMDIHAFSYLGFTNCPLICKSSIGTSNPKTYNSSSDVFFHPASRFDTFTKDSFNTIAYTLASYPTTTLKFQGYDGLSNPVI